MYDFIISGGGIGGLSVAVALQKLGYTIKVYEAAAEYLPVGAGLILSINAMKAYEVIGIADSIKAVGRVINEAQVCTQYGKVLAGSNFKTIGQKYGTSSYAIHRADLHDVLLTNLKADTVVLNKRTHSFSQKEEGVQLNFTDDTQVNARFLIAADGIYSPIRRQLHPNARPRYSGYTCWRGLCELEYPNYEQHIMTESWGWGERFGIVPLKDGQTYWFMVKNAPARDPLMSAYDKEKMIQVFSHWHEPVVPLLRATEEVHIIWNDIIDIEPLKEWGKNKVTLLGDAAHATTPNMGQGAAQSIEDAAFLMQCIQKYDASETAFRQYEKLRIPRTNSIIKKSWDIGRIAQLENPILTFFRDKMVGFTPNSFNNKMLDSLFSINFVV